MCETLTARAAAAVLPALAARGVAAAAALEATRFDRDDDAADEAMDGASEDALDWDRRMAAEARVCGRLLLAVGVDVENMLVLTLNAQSCAWSGEEETPPASSR